MKKTTRKQKWIITIAIVLIVVILAIVITTNIISSNSNLASEGYFATTANASSNLVASYIKSGITIGGITGTLETLDTSDATATPEDIALGKTAYVNGKKITGTYTDVPIPDGFYYVGGTEDTGLIISDSQEDENKGVDYPASSFKGNQFVWVPVENPSELFTDIDTGVKLNGVETITNVYSKLTVINGDRDEFTVGKPGETYKIREPDVLSSFDTDSQYYKTILRFDSTKAMADSFVQEYKAMSDSIKKYNGFYIGRYEISGSVDSPTEKKGTSITNQNWYNLYKACQNVVQGKENVKSTMIYGVQWDALATWLSKSGFTDANSTDWGNYFFSSGNAAIEGAGSKQDTGFSDFWKANNIYDIAGNCWELTQEANSTSYRIRRGGGCNYSTTSSSAFCRSNVDSGYSHGYYSSRATLYIK